MTRLLALFFALLPLPAIAQEAGTPIVIGQSYKIASTDLKRTYTINVWLPPSYKEGKASYPVLYVLDGGINEDFHHISGIAQLGTIVGTTRDMIVIGIEQEDRRAELAFPVTTDAKLKADFPTAGQSALFRDFIAKQVKPWVEARYRTSGEDALIGESLAGLFVVETMLRAPDLFDDWIAISPSLWWDKEALVKFAPTLLPRATGRLWLSVANEQGMGVAPFVELLQAQAPAALEWTFTPRRNETHATTYHPAALDAVRALYPVTEAAK